MIERFLPSFSGSENECSHETHDIWPREDEDIWYLLDEEYGREYWCARDAAYIKLRETDKKFVCLGCGVERTIQSAERVGGEDAIKLKEELSPVEHDRLRQEVNCGAFVNGALPPQDTSS